MYRSSQQASSQQLYVTMQNCSRYVRQNSESEESFYTALENFPEDTQTEVGDDDSSELSSTLEWPNSSALSSTLEWPNFLSPEEIVRNATDIDPFLSKFKNLVENRDYASIARLGEYYKPLQKQFSVVCGIIFIGNRIVIPDRLQAAVVQSIHNGHPGYERMCKLAERVWWPGLNTTLIHTVQDCELCVSSGKSSKSSSLKSYKYSFI